MRPFVPVAASILASFGAASASAAPLFGIGGFAPFADQGLYSIDTDTGAATLIGLTGLTNVADIAYDPATNRLLALTVAADLYQINLLTGAASPIAFQPETGTEGALSFDPAGSLFASRNDRLGLINQTSAAFSPVGASMGLAASDISGMAFVGSSLLGYSKNGSDPDTLVQIDTVTGIAQTLGTLGLSSAAAVGGLAFDNASDTLFLTDGQTLHRVDLTTYTATAVGAHGFAGFSGLAVVPSPGSLVLLTVGGLLLRRRR